MATIARILVVVLFFPFFPVWAHSQSLGSVAKKERERREKNKAEGVEVREITEDEVGAGGEPDDATASEGRDPESDDTEGEPSGLPSVSPFANSVNPSGEKRKSLDDEQADRKRREAQWKARARDARERLETARKRVQQLEGLHLVEGERYVDTEGRTVIASPEHLNQLVSQANAELKAAEEGLERMREEARRGGIPPGWIR